MNIHKNFPHLNDLNSGERHLIEWQYNCGGFFFTMLWNAISRADDGNLARLSLGFPEDVEAYLRFRDEEGYWGNLQWLATEGNISPEEKREIEAQQAETRG